MKMIHHQGTKVNKIRLVKNIVLCTISLIPISWCSLVFLVFLVVKKYA